MNKEDDISWYHDNISRTEAEDLLLAEGNAEGTFLVRKSRTSPGDFVLSVLKDNVVEHFQIRSLAEDGFYSIILNTKVHGLESLIELYQKRPDGIDGVKLTDYIKGDLPPPHTRRHGHTNLLHRATKCGNYVVVRALLKTGYRHEAKNEDGQTAVHLASMMGENDILRELIEVGANVNLKDTAAYTPLHYACQKNLISTVKLLVREGKANIQARNTENGWVPLHEAASAGHKEVVQELLIMNAPVRPRTNKNELPSTLARANGHIECAEILEKYKTPSPKTNRNMWYHGTMSRTEAESCMRNFSTENGAFLVRYTIRNKADVLTLYNQGEYFNYIVKTEGNYHFIDEGPYLDSLEHVIEHYSFLSDGLPTILQVPVPPKPKPPVPECTTIPRQKKNRAKLSPSTSSSQFCINSDHSVPSHFNNIHFTSDLELNDNTTNNNDYGADDTSEHSDYIPNESLKLISILGEGEFGSVWKGKFIQTNGVEIDVAIKTLRNDTVCNRESFLREAKVMMHLNHDCIVKLIGLSLGPPLHMVQELMTCDSMLQYIINNKHTISPRTEFIIWASQIACGMQYLEQQRFVHRDVAARNILLASRYRAKIGDFGLSRALRSDDEFYNATIGGKWPLKWYAPESFNFGKFSHKSDVWSFGVTIWEMYSYGSHPYGDRKGTEVIVAINNGERLEKPLDCPDHVYDIMMSCWELDAEKRPTFIQLYQFFSSDSDYMNISELITESHIDV